MHVDNAHTEARRRSGHVTRKFTPAELNALVNAILTAQHYAPALRENPDLNGLFEGWEVAVTYNTVTR